MGRKLKKGQAGNVVKYVTRTQAVKRLQLRLAEFRRLCILKGIHPREPKKKVKGQNKTYYHVKDINFLAHEPLLESFRAISAYEKKVRKARARRNLELAQQLARRAPGYSLDHLVRERYPTFVDALRDIDDALCMVHLFATLPADERREVPVKMINTSRRLVLEWQALCCRTHAVRKAFISVKGFYFQAEVQGQMVTWLMPHSTAQVLPADVDYRVMLTFLEFYLTQLQFVFYKLYHGLGLTYPPSSGAQLEAAAQELAVIMRELGGSQEAAIAKRAEAAALSEKQLKERIETLPESLKVAAAPAAAGLQSARIEVYGGDNGEEAEDDDDDDGDDEALLVDSGSDDDKDGDDDGAHTEPLDAAAEQAIRMRPAQAEDVDDDDEDAEADAGARAAGGALALAAITDADVCSTLFAGFVIWLGREVPRETLMLLVRSFGGIAAWEGPGSPYSEDDDSITHQVVDRPVQGHVHLGRTYVQPQWVFDSVNFRLLVPAGDYAPGRKPPPHLSPFLDYQEEGYVPDYAREMLKLQEAATAARKRAAGMDLEGGAEAFVAGDVADAAEAPPAQQAVAAEELFHEQLAEELGAAGQVKKAAKRKHEEVEEELADSQKKALMTRKQRKMYTGLRKKEAEKAERIAELQAKKATIGKRKNAA